MDIRLIWLALGTFAIGAEAFALPSLLPDIAADTGVSLVQGGYLVLAFAMAYAIGSPILAALTGASDRRRVLALTALVYAGGTIIAGFAANYGMLMAARVLMALASGLFAATAQATGVAMSEPAHRARAISVIVGGTTLAVAFGAPLGGLVAHFSSWRGTYFVMGGMTLVAAVAIYAMLPAGLKGVRVPLRDRLAVFVQPGVRPALLTMMLYMIGGFTVFTYFAPLAVTTIGLDKALLPAVLLAFGVGAAAGNIAGGQLADRFGAKATVIGASILLSIVTLLMSAVTHLDHTIAGPVFVGLMVAWGLVAWAFPPAQASRILKLAPTNAPLVLSLNASALYFGVALGSVVGGQVLQHGTPADLGWVGAIFPLLGLAVLLATDPEPVLARAAPRLG
ncbi:MFS transporter [Devosia sp.]|uniref:MFS transporter n=1 Tax=Devosia sp. TaxID=1871048 RepID=UPI0032675080